MMRVLVLGKSGAGESTCAKALPRAFDDVLAELRSVMARRPHWVIRRDGVKREPG